MFIYRDTESEQCTSCFVVVVFVVLNKQHFPSKRRQCVEVVCLLLMSVVCEGGAPADAMQHERAETPQSDSLAIPASFRLQLTP